MHIFIVIHCVMKKTYKYPTLTVRISQKHREMLDEIKNKYYINISKIFRDTIEKVYRGAKK